MISDRNEGSILAVPLHGLVAVGILGVLGILLVSAFSLASLGTLVGAATSGMPVATASPDEIPPDQLAAMHAAAASAPCDVSWQILAGVARVASDFGRHLGERGYASLGAADWQRYGQGGDPREYAAALPALASYLCGHAGGTDLRGALFGIFGSDQAVDTVFALAARYGYVAPGSLDEQVVTLARAQMGVLYVWGGADPTGFDCSGLVQWVHRQLGVRLPRTAQQQYDATMRVARQDLQPGDLVFFAGTYEWHEYITHVGIYAGNGMMINAPSERYPVKEQPVFTGYWASYYAGAGRVKGP